MPKIIDGPAEIGVAMGAYNAEKYIQQALDSIARQSFTGTVQIVVVNDGSTDATEEIARNQKYPLKVITQENRGVLGSRKRAIEALQSKYISVLDADDLYTPEKLEAQYDFLETHPEFDLAICHLEQFVSEDTAKSAFLELPEHLKHMKAMNFQGTMFRSDLLQKVPLHDLGAIRNGDYLDWFMRVKESGAKFHVLDQVLVKRRIHDTNTGILEKEVEQQDYLKIIRAKLARAKQRKP